MRSSGWGSIKGPGAIYMCGPGSDFDLSSISVVVVVGFMVSFQGGSQM